MRRSVKFAQNRSNRSGDMAIFRFFKMAAAVVLDFQNFKLLTVGRLKRTELRHHAKFGRNWPNPAKIWQFFYFSRCRRHLAFLNFWSFNGRTPQEGQSAPLCQVWSKSVKTRPRYGDFSIFQDRGRRHLAFLNFWNFNGRNTQKCQTASPCQISSKSVTPRPRYGDFSIGFSKFQTFKGRTAQECRSASSCEIWSKSVKTRPR